MMIAITITTTAIAIATIVDFRFRVSSRKSYCFHRQQGPQHHLVLKLQGLD